MCFYRVAGFFCKVQFLRSINFSTQQWLLYLWSNLLPNYMSCKIVTCSGVWSWILCRLNHYYYRLCDQRTPHLHGCLGGLATLEKCCNVVVRMIHTTIMIHWPFGWVRQRSRSVPLLKHLNRDICRVKGSQVQNCDMYSELKLKCKSNCRVKICKLVTARLLYCNLHKLGPCRQNPLYSMFAGVFCCVTDYHT